MVSFAAKLNLFGFIRKKRFITFFIPFFEILDKCMEMASFFAYPATIYFVF
jgi:hypothetical protein